jgi:hypothetical protein
MPKPGAEVPREHSEANRRRSSARPAASRDAWSSLRAAGAAAEEEKEAEEDELQGGKGEGSRSRGGR